MKRLFILIIISPLFLIAQNDAIDLNNTVNGIMTSGEGTYLILDQGVIEINKTNIYTEYYRQIYNDSTLINPNTELKDDFSFSLIPFYNVDAFENRIDFSEPKNLGIFLQLNRSGEYEFTRFGESYIDSIRSK